MGSNPTAVAFSLDETEGRIKGLLLSIPIQLDVIKSSVIILTVWPSG